MARQSPALVPVILRPIIASELPFDADLATFTPSMATRAGTVFAGAPIVQGKFDGTGTPDVLTFARGDAVSGVWYDNFDPYQGSFVFWVTPEWEGDDGLNHFLFNASRGPLNIVKRSTNVLALRNGLAVLVDVDVSAWDAGTTYCIVARWDSKNTIDGTNHACISIDGAHTFKGTSSWDAGAPSATQTIGSALGAPNTLGANALIEGLFLFRRVLWDGAYGTDVNGGIDEIALISAGADPCAIAGGGGSWDCTFGLPTDSTPAALVTGTGHAHSHPHDLALLTDSWCDTTYADSAWDTEGTPSTGPADQAAADKVYHGGYKWTCDAADEGVAQTKSGLTPGADYSVRCIAHTDSADDITLLVYDNTNAANIVSYAFGASSTVAAPGVAEITLELPASCTEIIVKVMGTAASQVVYLHECEVQANLWDDPSCEAGTAPTDVGTPTSSAQSADQAHSATNSWKVVAAAAGDGIKRAITTTSGVFYHASAWVYAATAGTVDMEGPTFQDGNTARIVSSGNDAWVHVSGVFRATAASTDLQFTSNAAQTFYVDDVAVIALNPVSLTATPRSEANSVELGGLSIDGRDTCTQPTGRLTRTHGEIRFSAIPRHDMDEVREWGQGVTERLFDLYIDANNRVTLFRENTPRLQLFVESNGAVLNDTWIAAWAAADQWNFVVKWNPARLWVLVNGAEQLSIAWVSPFTTAPATINWGTTAGDQQFDGVILP